MRKKKIKKFNPGPITVIIILSIGLMVLSFLLNKIGLKGKLTDSNTLETTTITVNNFFTKEGFRHVIGSSLKNFRSIEPLVAIIVAADWLASRIKEKEIVQDETNTESGTK